MTDTEKLADMLRSSRHTVFFGGAGVSTESGLKDYRSRDGIYHTAVNYGMTPEQILSHDVFFQKPALFYRFFRDFFLQEAQPNITHRALAELERQGREVTVVTQNIDGLHQKAGSRRVYELHGTAATLHCVACSRAYPAACLRSGGDAVPHCACGGLLKPDVVLYGEPLDEAVVNGAIEAIAAADLLIIGGTSLAVYPAAGFIRYFRGKELVIVNRDSTDYDSRASLVLHESLGRVFGDVMTRLG